MIKIDNNLIMRVFEVLRNDIQNEKKDLYLFILFIFWREGVESKGIQFLGYKNDVFFEVLYWFWLQLKIRKKIMCWEVGGLREGWYGRFGLISYGM